MPSRPVQKLTYSALFLAIALVLPFITGRIPEIGSALCPMHIPVLLCGFICGWPWGMAAGMTAPLLSSVLFGMPVMFPKAIAMMFELAVYGLVSGLLYRRLPRKKWSIYAVLIIAMLAGRIVYGIVYLVLLKTGLAVIGESLLHFVWIRAFVKPFPGIILHLVLVPVLVMALERAGLSLNRQ